MLSKLKIMGRSRISMKDVTCILIIRQPAYRWQEPDTGTLKEQGNMAVRTLRGKVQAINCKANTESAVRGGPGRSSEDASRKGGGAKGEDSEWKVFEKTTNTIQEIADKVNPVLTGWINYYGKFYKSKMIKFMRTVNVKLVNWARRKYKRLRVSFQRAAEWLNSIYMRRQSLFAHWKLLNSKPTAG